METVTKRPYKTHECVICTRKTTTNDGKWLQGRISIIKDMPILLEKYGGITLTKGFMCMKCVRRLLGIHKRVQQFRALCQKSPHSVVTHKLIKVPPPNGNETKLNIATPVKLVPIHKAVTSAPSYLNAELKVSMTKEMTSQGPKPALIVQGPPPSSFANFPQVLASCLQAPMNQRPQQSFVSTKSTFSMVGAPQAVLVPVQPVPGERVMPPLGIPMQTSFRVGQAPGAGSCSPSRPKLIAPKKTTSTEPKPANTDDTDKQGSNTDLPLALTTKESNASTISSAKTSQDTERDTEAEELASYSFSDDHCYHLKGVCAADILGRHANEWLRHRNNWHTEFLSMNDIKSMVSKVVEGSVDKIAEAAMGIPGLRKRIVACLMTEMDTAFAQISNRKIGTLSCLKPAHCENTTIFDWDKVILEMNMVVPELLQICLAASNRASYLEKCMGKAMKESVPRIGMAFAIFAQGRIRELNKVQRIISLLLRKNGCDGKAIYVKLNHLGLCTSYTQMLAHMQAIAEEKKKARARKRQNEGESSGDEEDDIDVGTADSVTVVQTPGSVSEDQTVAGTCAATPICAASRFGGAKKIFLVPKSK